jgi:peptidoglycan/LPS O-acetylase OafA/YrhL
VSSSVQSAGDKRIAVSFNYRPSLDGLRAIAALLVVLFHAGVPFLSKGFIGVDIFFVLSGFLITSLLVREIIGTHRLDLLAFYARRARRLLPPAILVLVVTAIAFNMLATPMHVALDKGGFAAAALYVSNWYFLAQSQDYFAVDRDPSPVLHYWSLSVEEQFYLIWPLLLLALVLLTRYRASRLSAVVGGLLLAGVAYTAWLSGVAPMTAYFGTLARAYQLLLGAAIGLWVFRRQLTGRAKSEDSEGGVTAWLAPLGLVLVLVASTTFWGEASVFTRGVMGCVGAGLLLVGFETNPASRLAAFLSMRIPRRLGNYSYSMYLWHWPVVALASTVGILPTGWATRVLVVVPVTIGLAAATWWLVEKPIRSINLDTIRMRRRVALAGPITAIAAAAFVIVALPVNSHTQGLIDAAGLNATTISGTQVDRSDGAVASDFSMLVVGDSHAGFWTDPLAAEAESHGWSLTSVHDNGCPWPRVASTGDAGRLMQCDEDLRDHAVATAKDLHPDVVLLVSHSVVMRPVATASGILAPGDPGWLTTVTAGSKSFIDELEPYTDHIVIMQVIPQTESPMIDCLSTEASPSSCDSPVFTPRGTSELENAWAKIAASRSDVSVIDLDNLICPDGVCPSEVDGVVTFRDENHLTDQYAASLVDDLVNKLKGKGIQIP